MHELDCRALGQGLAEMINRKRPCFTPSRRRSLPTHMQPLCFTRSAWMHPLLTLTLTQCTGFGCQGRRPNQANRDGWGWPPSGSASKSAVIILSLVVAETFRVSLCLMAPASLASPRALELFSGSGCHHQCHGLSQPGSGPSSGSLALRVNWDAGHGLGCPQFKLDRD